MTDIHFKRACAGDYYGSFFGGVNANEVPILQA